MATVSRLSNTGIMYTSGEIDEVTNNLAALGSMSFNGTTQYVTVPTSNFIPAVNTYTIEMWLNPSAYPGAGVSACLYHVSNATVASFGAILITFFGTGTIRFEVRPSTGGTNIQLNSSTTVPLNVWTHVAIVVTAGAAVIYLNGVSRATGTVVVMNDTQTFCSIGWLNNGYVTNQTYYNGAIANFRVVRGIAVYTGAFTPPTEPKLITTQLAGTNIAAITNAANTTLLLSTLYNNATKDFSDNNFNITSNAIPTSIQSHPFNPDGYYSYLFNGSQYLSYSPGSSLTFGSSNFTVEMWIYPTVTIPSTAYLFDTRFGGGGSWCFGWGLGSFGASLQWYNGGVIVTDPSASSTYLPNTWYHVAYVKNGSTGTLYRNGVAVVSATDSSTYTTASTTSTIGVSSGIAQAFTGYISNLRIVKGTAVYTAAFTSPTAPLTAITNTVLLTLQSNRIKDNSTTNATITSAVTTGPTIYSNTLPFSSLYANTGLAVSKQYSNGMFQTVGSFDEVSLNPTLNGSVLFNGSTQYLSVPNATALQLATGDFTIEFWMNPTSTSAGTPFAKRATNLVYGGASFYFVSNKLGLTVANAAGSAWSINDSTTMPTMSTNTWYHVVLQRVGNNIRTFVNGALYINSTAIASGTSIYDDGSTFVVGAGGSNGSQPFPGYISNLRVVKGTTVYTINFTSSTSPLTTTSQNATASQVRLLTAQSATITDTSLNNTTITNTGTVTSGNSVIPFASTYSYQFNGSSQYLSVPNINFSTNAFTIEGWFYPTTLATLTNFWGTDNGPGTTPKMVMYINSSSQLTVDMGTSGSTQFPTVVSSFSTYGLVINAWSHIALVRNDLTTNGLKLYINGQLAGAGQLGTNLNTITAIFNIGYIGEAYGQKFSGYISNFRIINGSAVYGAFTPPTQALTTTQPAGTNIAAITNQTSFLMRTLITDASDISTNNLTITPVGTPTNSAANPFGTDIYGSMLFNGTSQYLATPSTSALNFGTGNYTVEGWFYWTSVPGNGRPFINGQTTGSFQFYWDGGTYVANKLTISNRSTNQLQVTFIPVVNTWYHIAAVRNTGTVSLYVNGVSLGSTADSTNYATTAIYNIGGDAGNAGTWYFPGYISNLRVVNGTAVYTGAFTPPTVPLTAITNTSLLTCQSIANQDNSTNVLSNKVVLTNTGSTPTSSTNPFSRGYSSVSFNGTTQYLTVAHNTVLSLTTGNFTIEGWIRTNSFANSPSFFYKRATRLIFSQIGIAVSTAGRLALLVSNAAGSAWSINDTTSMPVMSTGTWYHFALVRNGDNIQMYLDGTQYINSTAISSATTIRDDSSAVSIGASAADGGGVSLPYDGYISNFRIVKGTAVYTGAFTPPTAPLTTITNTSLLTCQSMTFIDSSSNKFTITNNGGATADQAIVPFQPSAIDPVVTSGTTLRKQYNTGLIQVYNQFDDYTGIV